MMYRKPSEAGGDEPRMNYLFGPVASRRLGRSLGVDVLEFKTCTLDCIYCELGRTPSPTTARREYAPVEAVLAEVRAWYAAGGAAEVITLAGSGEPTLHSRFGEIIRGIKEAGPLPVCLLTNGTLFGMPEVRRDAALADMVVPSLDAPSRAVFEKINRPEAGLDYDAYVDGLRAFAREYRGRLWLEVFIVPGVNDDEPTVRRLAALASSLHPEKIQLNTAVRPAAESFVQPVQPERLEAFAALFTPRADVPGSFNRPFGADLPVQAESIVALVRRRPCTLDDIAQGLAFNPADAARMVAELCHAGCVTTETRDGETYYRAAG
ncbi:radical SAM protein [bacterium]|nr:radical SAM protein [bacterium]